MDEKSILVTGGCGFIGTNLVEVALSAGYRVGNLDKLTYAGHLDHALSSRRSSPYVFRQGDICDFPLLQSFLENLKPSAIVHLAAETHVDRSIDGPEKFIHTNIVGTHTLLGATLQYWRQLPEVERDTFRFLHVSTDEVFGSLGPEGLFQESTPYAPRSPYAASKASSDHLVRAYGHTYGLPVIVSHCSNNYGPRQYPEKLIPLVINRAIRGEALPVYGDGQNIRDWIYVEDHCRALLSLLRKGKTGETYLVGANNEKSNLDVVLSTCSILDELHPRADHRRYVEQLAFVEDRPGHDRRYAVDASKIMRESGWKPRVRFNEGLRMTVEWYLSNQRWVEAALSGDYGLERLGVLKPGVVS